jgi:ABC-2 type transport system ATP-binding protein
MNGIVRAILACAAAGAAALAAAAPAAAASRDAIVPSFDGTPIVLTLHPAEGLKPGQRAPTILQTHGWGGSRQTDPNAASDETTGNVGVGPLRRAGFNVLSWDSRGFGDSGGIVSVDAPDLEGRDVEALITWLAKQPEARLDGPGDPRVGMEGVSYAGGIELTAAALDKRIDAIAPTIAWHSLLTALYREDTIKGGWSSLLVAAGEPSANGDGLDSPAGPQTGGLDPHIHSAFASGASTGHISAADKAWFDSRGPGDLVEQIRVPTMLVQGTADTLFTLSEAMRNAAVLKRNGVPFKMLWFCGGHGVCLTGQGPKGYVEQQVIAWLRHHLAGQRAVSTGPQFEWLADDAQWRSTPAYPAPAGPPLTGDGKGTLNVSPADALSGTPVSAGVAPNALDVPITPRAADVTGEPTVTMTYSAVGTGDGYVFAQIADGTRNLVLGNVVTPIPIVLDGAPHTITRSLEGVAAHVTPGSKYRLQLTGGSQVYGPSRTLASITFSKVHVELPTITGAHVGTQPLQVQGGLLPSWRRCSSRRRFTIHLKRFGHSRLRSARVSVDGRRVKVRRRHGRLTAVVDLRGKPKKTVRVSVRAVTRSGTIVRDTRRYHTCAGAKR